MSRIHPAQIMIDDIRTHEGLLGEVYEILYRLCLDQQVEVAEKAFTKHADHYFRAPQTGYKLVEAVLDECFETYYKQVLEQVESDLSGGIKLARRIRFAMNDLSYLGYPFGPFVKKYAGFVFLAAVWAVHDAVIPSKNEHTRFLNETHEASISLGLQAASKVYLS